MGLFNFFTQEIAMDLGTANTLIIHNDEVVVNEPSIVALNRNNMKEVLAVGKKALMMHEKTHESIRTVRPLKDGVIADFNAAELMIRELIKMIYLKKPLFPPSWRMVICIPSSITEVEKRAVRDSAEQAGAKEVYMIHEPMAAALGIGIDVEEPVGNMIIDIGGGTTEHVGENQHPVARVGDSKRRGDRRAHLIDALLRFDSHRLEGGGLGNDQAQGLKHLLAQAVVGNDQYSNLHHTFSTSL